MIRTVSFAVMVREFFDLKFWAYVAAMVGCTLWAVLLVQFFFGQQVLLEEQNKLVAGLEMIIMLGAGAFMSFKAWNRARGFGG